MIKYSNGNHQELSQRHAKQMLAAFGFLFLFFLFGSSLANAQMGPDYWQVTGVPANDHLNVRSGPGARNPIVATAPNGFSFRNLGCQGSGNSRWCHVETPDGRTSGWVSGRYLREAGTPVAARQPQDDIPELHIRRSGEIEVRYQSGCTALYNPVGRRITAGSSCSRGQLNRAHNAVESYMRENSPAVTHGPDRTSRNVSLSGTGTFYGGDALRGTIMGHKEGAYALAFNSVEGSPLCTALIRHAPGTVKSEAAAVHCTNGAHGTAVLARNRSGNGLTMSFTLNDGAGGYVLF